MAKPIARISGVALRPGISRNQRYYSPDAVASAVRRAQERIASGGSPISMRSHHAAEDDSTRLVGRLTRIDLSDDGSATYEAELADTAHARTLLALIDKDGPAFLEGVSIRGRWLDDPRRQTVDGKVCDTADDLEIDGLDFTATPGVPGARVSSVTKLGGRPRESVDDRSLIYESVEDTQVITESVPDAKPLHADPGYLTDRSPRYPLNTVGEARAAWWALRENRDGYSPAQLKRCRERTRKTLERHGVRFDAGLLVESRDVAELDVWPDRPGSFGVNLDNGSVCISVSSYCVDPADLEVAARAAMDGACAALVAIDPDVDGDIDADDPETPDGDGDESRHPDDDAMESSVASDPSPVADPASGQTDQEQEPGVSEQTTPAAGSPAVPTTPAPAAAPVENVAAPVDAEPKLTLGQVKDLFASFAGAMGAMVPAAAAPVAAPAEAAPAAPAPVAEAAPAAPAAPVVEAPAAVQETEEQRIERIVAERVAAAMPTAVQEHVQVNGVPRKGLVVEAAAPAAVPAATDEYPESWPRENGVPVEPHRLSAEQFRQVRADILPGAVLGAFNRRSS